MNIGEEKIVEIENPISLNWNVFRNWLLPSLMEFFSNNQHVSYPQKIFEIGDVVLIDNKMETRTRNVRKLAVAIADSHIAYNDIAAVLGALLKKFNLRYKLKKCKHKTFIDGRIADILIKNKPAGSIGEIHPLVLKNWRLEMPAVAFEIDLNCLDKSFNQRKV